MKAPNILGYVKALDGAVVKYVIEKQWWLYIMVGGAALAVIVFMRG